MSKSDQENFDRWLYSAVDDRHMVDGKAVPLLTTLLYRVCDGDGRKFEDVTKALQAAFEAGLGKLQKPEEFPSRRG
jgi:hypothetical protein